MAIALAFALNDGCARKCTSTWLIAGLSAWPRWRGARSLGLLEEPARAFRESDLLRRLFEAVVRRCIGEGLVGGDGVAVDASLIKAEANRQKGVEGTKGLPPELTSRAIDEYLAGLDDAALGAATEVIPKFISPVDPAARWTGAHGGQAFFAYSDNYLVDLGHSIIVDVEPSTAVRQAEVTAAKTMISRSEGQFGLHPARLAGDWSYGSAEMLQWLVYERGIEPHIPVFDRSKRADDTFSRSDPNVSAGISTRPLASRARVHCSGAIKQESSDRFHCQRRLSAGRHLRFVHRNGGRSIRSIARTPISCLLGGQDLAKSKARRRGLPARGNIDSTHHEPRVAPTRAALAG